MAKAYSTTPSSLLSLDDPYEAYCLNEACYTWGTHVEAELKEATKEAEDEKQADRKVQLAWRRLFDDEDAELAKSGQFRDPMQMMGSS